ncbi:hypothetical protein BDR03DRAFT_958397 [Suillus americanus]|nr:hypothetical protein BDR03DRAFT_958397 [Suillus americanus]
MPYRDRLHPATTTPSHVIGTFFFCLFLLNIIPRAPATALCMYVFVFVFVFSFSLSSNFY